jgi:hypothetical protein
MFVVRDVFRCKPGAAKVLAERFKKGLGLLTQDEFRNGRILVDYVATYWTVVLESEVNDLAEFDRHMQEWGGRADVREAMGNYMELVDGGHREIFRVL